MEADALYRQFNGESSRMRTLLGSLVNRLVRDKPRVASATFVLPIGVRPALNISLVRVRNSNGQTINLAFPLWREVKNILMAIVYKARRVDWFEMPVRRNTSFSFDGNGFYPVNRVLKLEQFTDPHRNRKCQKRIFR